MPLSLTPEWSALRRAALRRRPDARKLLAEESRLDAFVAEACGLRLDLTRQRFTREELELLLSLARARDVRGAAERMFRGDHVNATEDRAALHTALRAPAGSGLAVDGLDVDAAVQSELARMEEFAHAIRSGARTGVRGKPFKTVVNLGIGGSDLGPRMVTAALRPYSDGALEVRFVSNVDPADLDRALAGLDPATTLFVVCSKTFTTLETIANAHAASDWLVESVGEDAVAAQMVAVSTAADQVKAFGIDPRTSMFGFWDWVGGRYSVASAVGLSAMLAIGPHAFRDLLAGMHEMDEHFRTAPAARSLPVLLALAWLWNGSLAGCDSAAVLPYSSDLNLFPVFLQQLDMESNGKSVLSDGSPAEVETGPVVWGEAGTDGQHAFHQLLHQGTRTVPVDLIGFARSADPAAQDRQDLLLANLIAQAEALSIGRTRREAAASGGSKLAAHRTFEGGKPVTVILAERLDPRTLGALIALYEHKVFVQAAIWGINPFDQWGVELGKELASTIAPELADPHRRAKHDASTAALIEAARSLRD